MASLGERVHLRNRLGLQVAFCEDPLLEGMLEGVAMKGMTKGLKKAAQAEALEAAKQAGSTEKREQEARTLIGPKGGLPTLRRDLLKLAALLRVDIAERDTVDTIKEKVKPMVNLLKEKPVPKLTAVKSAAKPRGAQPKSSAKEASASPLSADVRPISNLTEQHEALEEIAGKMAQEMQVLRSLLPAGAIGNPIDLTMVDVKTEPFEMSEEEMAAAMEDVYAERLMATYGTNDPDQLMADGVGLHEISD